MSPGAVSVHLGAKRVASCPDGHSPELGAANSSSLAGPAAGEARDSRYSLEESLEDPSSMAERAGLAPWARAVRARLAQIDAVRQRSDAISSRGIGIAHDDSMPGVGPVPSAQKVDVLAISGGELVKAAAERDFALRTLRAIADPLSYWLLARCVAKECSTDDLVGELHLPGVAVWERVNDLIQVGLVQRELDQAKVSATPAGLALYGILEGVVALAAEQGSTLNGGLTS